MNYFERAKYFKTKKRLGQNFLINGEVIRNILDYSNIASVDTVIEIGPGVGFVTEQLVKKAKKVIAIELDEEAVKELKKLDAPNLTIIHKDILKTNIAELCEEKVKVVANIPYYITSPIIAHLLGEIDDLNNANRNHITDILLMVQEEVALRMVANENSSAKQYGLLSFLSQFWADVKILEQITSEPLRQSELYFYASSSVRTNYNNMLDALVNDAKTNIDATANDLELVLKIHDYTLAKTEYAYEDDGTTPKEAIWAHNIIGFVENHKGVCESYAKAFIYLSRKFGIENIAVTGTSKNQNHMWNMVKIDDIYLIS